MLGAILAGIRLLTFVFTSSATLLAYFITSLFMGGLNLNRALRFRKAWIHFILWALGIKVKTYGTPPDYVGLVVSNHRSYIDPVVTLKDIIALPIGKIEVSKWPLVGKGAQATGVIYVNRSSKNSRQETRDAMVKTIEGGNNVLIYPEGTTVKRPGLLEFRPGTFQEAAKYGIPVTPVAIEYFHTDDAWVGKDTFVRHFFQCFAKWRTHAIIWYGPKISAEDPEELREKARNWIHAHLLKIADLWETSPEKTEVPS